MYFGLRETLGLIDNKSLDEKIIFNSVHIFISL